MKNRFLDRLHGKCPAWIGPSLIAGAVALGCAGLVHSGMAENAQAAQLTSPYVALGTGRVDVEGGLIKLAVNRKGVLRQVAVKEGDWVRQGQILASLESPADAMEVERLRRELAQNKTLAQDLQAMDETEVLMAAHFQSRANSMASLQAATVRSGLAHHRADLASVERKRALTEVELTARDYELEQNRVRAPLDGRIVRRLAQAVEGTGLASQTPLLLFAPNNPRIVRAEIDKRYLDKVQPGMSAEVTLESDESQTFPARVMSLSRASGQVDLADGSNVRQRDDSLAECVLNLDVPAALVGQKVRVKIRS